MLDRSGSRMMKWVVLAAVALVFALLASAGVFDDLFAGLGGAIEDLLHDLNHQ
jgi:hypothetical protein